MVAKSLLLTYPEENLLERKVFKSAFTNDCIEFKALVTECSKILIPWQMFFLNLNNFKKQLQHIERQRQDKVSSKLVSKRTGSGNVTSKRIIDRLIRQQNFLVKIGKFESNKICGSIKNLSSFNAANKLVELLRLDREKLWRYSSKQTALDYLITLAENSNINVSRGVLANKLLPNHRVVPSKIYRNTSGFVIKDDCVPYIFIPSEINPDEVESRQIYTLIYLLVVIGLDKYDYFLESDFTSKITKVRGVSKLLHSITTELLIPRAETKVISGSELTSDDVKSLSLKFKVSPLALLTTLLIRKVIVKAKYDELKPPPFLPNKIVRRVRTAKVSTSVEKFCGGKSFKAINGSIKSNLITKTQAQYLIFGYINKKGYIKYCNELGI
jgi:hypothetical protein